ncbi:hypothetical protein ABZ297_13725 [Nonomuraea sp. NPDC005983]|uniref:hypothetical protein n=1 Tax=Nonomuraea sp. NPDC005983 TaxID=3155595 RepID=UPI0033BCC0D0
MTEPSGDSKPKRPVVVPAVALVAVTAIGITALLGGLEERPDPAPPQLAAGKTLDQGQFETEFVESKVTLVKAENEYSKDKRYLDVVFKVTNKTDETVNVGTVPDAKDGGFSFGASLLKMTPEIKTQFGPRLFATSKDVTSSQLQPDVPTTVVARYELEGSAQPPSKITLDVGAFENLENPLTGSSFWTVTTKEGYLDKAETKEVAATVTLPVKAEGTT